MILFVIDLAFFLSPPPPFFWLSSSTCLWCWAGSQISPGELLAGAELVFYSLVIWLYVKGFMWAHTNAHCELVQFPAGTGLYKIRCSVASHMKGSKSPSHLQCKTKPVRWGSAMRNATPCGGLCFETNAFLTDCFQYCRAEFVHGRKYGVAWDHPVRIPTYQYYF